MFFSLLFREIRRRYRTDEKERRYATSSYEFEQDDHVTSNDDILEKRVQSARQASAKPASNDDILEQRVQSARQASAKPASNDDILEQRVQSARLASAVNKSTALPQTTTTTTALRASTSRGSDRSKSTIKSAEQKSTENAKNQGSFLCSNFKKV